MFGIILCSTKTELDRSHRKDARYENVKGNIFLETMSRRLIRRPKTRWVDDVRKDIQKLKVPNWKTLAQAYATHSTLKPVPTLPR
jgi:hypothetical protein